MPIICIIASARTRCWRSVEFCLHCPLPRHSTPLTRQVVYPSRHSASAPQHGLCRLPPVHVAAHSDVCWLVLLSAVSSPLALAQAHGLLQTTHSDALVVRDVMLCPAGAAKDAELPAAAVTEVAKNPGPRIVYPSVSSLPRIYRSVVNPPSSSFPHQPHPSTGAHCKQQMYTCCVSILICLHCDQTNDGSDGWAVI